MLWGDCNRICWNPWACYTFQHMTSFCVAEASFGCSTLKHLCHTCCHDGVFGFPCSHRFGGRVLCLEGGHFKFWESRPLIRRGWTIELVSFESFEFRSLNEKLGGYLRSQFLCHVCWSGWSEVGIYTSSFHSFIFAQFWTFVSFFLWLISGLPKNWSLISFFKKHFH